ncbi:uncharacterized protein LOC135484594 [Lineus longissimus]|uniref:uncharacterized protein LOC135484594 n=1 Tax=Lineus longissimus TaxID=88925 RepID=UPI002B4F85C4
MMKKYPKPPNNWLNKTNIISFFFAWNAFGILLYRRFVRNKDDEKESEMNKLTFKQRYLKAIYGEEDNQKFRHYKMKGLTVGAKIETTLGDLVAPAPGEETDNKDNKTTLQDMQPPVQESV